LNRLPTLLLESLQGLPGFNRSAFEAAHASGGQVTSIRFNPAKLSTTNNEQGILNDDWHSTGPGHDSRLMTHVPWSSFGYYLTDRPSFTLDPLFHAGTYYVQEASSMFLEQALKQSIDINRSLRVLDLCAAPGGKSTLLQSLLNKESLLVSNEVIKSRAAILEENLVKWGAANTIATNNDPLHFARLENYFNVIVIDAPCSGSGLFRRDPLAIDEWSGNNVALCSQRQQRIIADAWPALQPGGLLIYSTCSYSAAEDEDILDWMINNLQAESKRLQLNDDWHIIETFSPAHHGAGYRFYPDKLKGEGFFIAVVQKKEDATAFEPKPGKNKLEQVTKTEQALVEPWLNNGNAIVLFKQHDSIIALPAGLEKEIPLLQSALYIKHAGVTVGKIAGKDFIPAHALAMSSLINKNVPRIELDRQQALQYLRRDEFRLETTQKGWSLVSYRKHNLGWIKILPGRFNNYYPKEWRIIKQLPVQQA
jgi:16S rRNA C967 or C1407 C5-methylase (RsmB/RsmF family)/NOL1/NOP2/fmu family ribosome biogenesis protein